jgi:Carboxypeptidase regulatory-like domain
MRRIYGRSRAWRFSFGPLIVLLLFASPARPQTSTPIDPQTPAIVNGTVVDETGAAIAGAKVSLIHDDTSAGLDVLTSADGHFSCPSVPAGRFRLTVSAPGFANQTVTGVLKPGDVLTLPPVRLTVTIGNVDVDVTVTRVELAEQQLKEQTQQRLFGVLPNFRVSYRADAVPLTGRQKFKLTWKSVTDPTRFVGAAVVAGIQQARNDFSGFGPGADGYARRYAAFYGTTFTAAMVSNALLPTLFKQDPRYFYKGTGGTTSRVAYALSRAVVRKADNRRWQPDYSRILGSFASGALSNLYYPAEDRRSARLTFENAAFGIGGAAVGNLFQEFLFRKLTTHSRRSTDDQ